MGLFSKSILLLIVAVSTPLIYRQFANDNTIRFMSSYYSNYKSIDQFLRQSAGHLDRAKEYLPQTSQLKGVVERINKQFDDFVKSTAPEPATVNPPKEKSNEAVDDPRRKKEDSPTKFRVVECPNEEMTGKTMRLWDKKELAKFNGNPGENDILLAFMGLVYNVTMNSQHYGQGAEYSAFAGRDATRAFLTGNFTHDLTDDIRDLDMQLYSQLEGWISFYQSSYPVVGRIEGQFYDSNGCATKELDRIDQVFITLQQQKANIQKQEVELPECNSEWNGDLKKGRVWCSTKSGGIDRDWVGVPRIYAEGETQRCACFNPDDPKAERFRQHLSLYPDCDPSGSECPIVQ